jgi:hypothetical protein
LKISHSPKLGEPRRRVGWHFDAKGITASLKHTAADAFDVDHHAIGVGSLTFPNDLIVSASEVIE